MAPTRHSACRVYPPAAARNGCVPFSSAAKAISVSPAAARWTRPEHTDEPKMASARTKRLDVRSCLRMEYASGWLPSTRG